MGQGEPINGVISGNSDGRVLVEQEVDGGLLNYFLYVTVTLAAPHHSHRPPNFSGLRSQVSRILWELLGTTSRLVSGCEFGGWEW